MLAFRHVTYSRSDAIEMAGDPLRADYGVTLLCDQVEQAFGVPMPVGQLIHLAVAQSRCRGPRPLSGIDPSACGTGHTR